MQSHILVTGGAGFIGSNFVLRWIHSKATPVLNFDKLTYAGNLQNLTTISADPKHIFLREDINDSSAERLSYLVTGHPLSLRLLGGMFNNVKESIDQFIHNLDKWLPKARNTFGKRHKTVNHCIEYSFKYLDADLQQYLGRLRVFQVPFTSTIASRT